MATDRPTQHDDSAKKSAPAKGPRRAWVRPEIQDFGSTRHLVRGATGPLGDPGTAVGRRPLRR
jgi:hypothetical protein